MANKAHDTPDRPFERLLDEGVLLVTTAAEAEGIRISSKTALRWCLAGVRGIRLESVKAKGRRMTSRAAIRRFLGAIQPHASKGVEVLSTTAAEALLRSQGL